MAITQEEAKSLQPQIKQAEDRLAALRDAVDQAAAGVTVSPFRVAQLAAVTGRAVLDVVVQAEFSAGT